MTAKDIVTSGIDHVDLSVTDMARSVAFYDTVLTRLGYTRVSDEGTVCWRGPGAEIGVRAATSSPGSASFDRYRVGLHHLAIRASSRDDIERFHAFLRDENIAILEPPAEYPEYGAGYYAVFFADPDGIKLELVFRPSE